MINCFSMYPNDDAILARNVNKIVKVANYIDLLKM